ncbi:MAG: hypothetical protein ABSA75_10895 [Candidatus Bathyarchaeia archaeon]|jgi:hypothetical protein
MKITALVVIISLMAICVILAVYPFNVTSIAITVAADYSTASDSQSTLQSISMPVEYVNYTVSMVNGSLWATVDGTFPMHIPLEWVGQELPMLYPTPLGVTNISIEVDGQSVDYSNYTQAYPDALHYTYLGEWPMMLFTVQPASPDFLLTIHYQHPISVVNGTYVFLYDLNISPYLSNSSSESTAHFSILFQANCSNINIYTVPGDSSIPRDNTRTPVNFTISTEIGAQTVAFDITSSYSQPVPGDELITFQNSQSQVPEFSSRTILFSLIIMVTIVGLLVYCKKRKPYG